MQDSEQRAAVDQVLFIRVGVMLQKQLNGVVMTCLSSQHQRRTAVLHRY